MCQAAFDISFNFFDGVTNGKIAISDVDVLCDMCNGDILNNGTKLQLLKLHTACSEVNQFPQLSLEKVQLRMEASVLFHKKRAMLDLLLSVCDMLTQGKIKYTTSNFV